MAKRRNNDDMPDSQKSIRYYVEKNKPDEISTSLYSHMLTEDLHLGIMPIGWCPDRYKFKCKIEPESSAVEGMLCTSFPTHHGQPYYLTEAISDFVEECTHILTYFGKVFYEVVYVYTDEKKTKIDGFRLVQVSNSNIHSVLGFYWQFLPQKFINDELKYKKFALHDEENRKIKKFICLPRGDMFVLKYPRRLGGEKYLKKIISQLNWASKETIPKFYLKDLEAQKQHLGYDFSLYREQLEVFVLKITKKLGWPARSLSSDRLLEFYQLYRYLKFQHTKATMREYIIKKLNHKLIQIGKRADFQAQISIDNCPSARELEGHIQNLLAGKLQFSEIIKLTNLV